MTVKDSSPGEKADTTFSVRRSLVTPYVPYTVYVIAYSLVGVALGAATGTFNLVYAASVAVAIWFGLEGLHAIDLADDGVAVRLDNDIANTLGYFQVAVGSAIGLGLAWEVSWWYLVLVGAGAGLGLAYNEEWFGGYLHDRDKVTGLANFGVSWGLVPFLAGYFLMDQTIRPGILLVGAGIAIDAVRLNYLEGHGAIPRYDDVGIEHDRDHKSSADEARAACHSANVMMIGTWVTVAAGLVVLFIV